MTRGMRKRWTFASCRFGVPLSLRERVGVRGTRWRFRRSVLGPGETSPHPGPLPEGEGDLRTPHSAFAAVCSMLLALLLCCGCRGRTVESGYGQRSGPDASQSVNGTAVLGEMFAQAGHKVSSCRTLSPWLWRQADCIVWFPDDFRPPSKEVRQWLEGWLRAGDGRTLIYVGRDFDAASWYWEKVLPRVSGDQAKMVEEELAMTRLRFRSRREAMPKSEDCGWFTMRGEESPRPVRTLSSDEPGWRQWLDGVNAAKLDAALVGRIEPSTKADVLLKSKDDALLSRVKFGRSRLIVAANGSFLLNAMLVNHEHRKLAGKLIEQIRAPEQIESPEKTVVFLESGPAGPPIRKDEHDDSDSTGAAIFHLWPTNWILLHLAAAGILFCFARWPIFGRPRGADEPPPSEFARHVDALAELMSASRDADYANSRLLHYQENANEEKRKDEANR